jgi:uncharacterized peroxidase-related enzyme
MDAALREALERDPAGAPLPPRALALVAYALKLTERPGRVSEDDVAALRERGLTDAGVHDAAAVTAYFNFVNRVALGLGVELEPGHDAR